MNLDFSIPNNSITASALGALSIISLRLIFQTNLLLVLLSVVSIFDGPIVAWRLDNHVVSPVTLHHLSYLDLGTRLMGSQSNIRLDLRSSTDNPERVSIFQSFCGTGIAFTSFSIISSSATCIFVEFFGWFFWTPIIPAKLIAHNQGSNHVYL